MAMIKVLQNVMQLLLW